MTDDVHAGFNTLLGLEITAVSGDEVVASLEVRPELLQPYGLLHGGVLCSVVETVGSVAGAVWFGDRGKVVGTSNHTNFLRAVREGRLTAIATPIHRGRTQQLWTVDVRDEQDRLVAKGELRLANLPEE
ncbi:MAG: PaaI family thioesterase [Mycobacteriales bacterium]